MSIKNNPLTDDVELKSRSRESIIDDEPSKAMTVILLIFNSMIGGFKVLAFLGVIFGVIAIPVATIEAFHQELYGWAALGSLFVITGAGYIFNDINK